MPKDLTEHAARNREAWAVEASNYVASAKRSWARPEFSWGILGAPESELGLLGDVEGKDVVELGCGTAYFSAWLARRYVPFPTYTAPFIVTTWVVFLLGQALGAIAVVHRDIVITERRQAVLRCIGEDRMPLHGNHVRGDATEDGCRVS